MVLVLLFILRLISRTDKHTAEWIRNTSSVHKNIQRRIAGQYGEFTHTKVGTGLETHHMYHHQLEFDCGHEDPLISGELGLLRLWSNLFTGTRVLKETAGSLELTFWDSCVLHSGANNTTCKLIVLSMRMSRLNLSSSSSVNWGQQLLILVLGCVFTVMNIYPKRLFSHTNASIAMKSAMSGSRRALTMILMVSMSQCDRLNCVIICHQRVMFLCVCRLALGLFV